VLLFVSKARNLVSFLRKTYLSVWLPLDDLHSLHSWAGVIVGIEVMWHSFWHMLRWGLAGDMRLLVENTTGISGLISLSVTPLIVWPMCLRSLRRGIRFEVRKAAHYLAVVWGVSICFHAPAGHIAWVMGSAVGVYAVDFIYGLLFQTRIIDTLQLTRFGSSVEILWEAPEGTMEYWTGSGYIYICLPWVSKTEWHAFSLLRHPTKRNCLCVCMTILGDWTEAVHKELRKPSVRPGWVYGPFPSPFSTGIHYDNIIAVGSGIGITAALSSVACLNRRHVHLVWICRDPDLVEFYVKNALCGRGEDAWTFVFYTGERTPVLGDCLATGNRKVKIIFNRPNLHDVLVAIMNNACCGLPMPDELMEAAHAASKQLHMSNPDVLFHYALERAFATYTIEEFFELGLDLSHNATNTTMTVRPVQPPGRKPMLPNQDRTLDLCALPGVVPTSPSQYSRQPDLPSQMEEGWPSDFSRQVTGESTAQGSITADGFVQLVRQACQFDGDSKSGGMLGDEQFVEHFAVGAMDGEIHSVDGLEAALGSLRRAAKAAADEVQQADEVEATASPASKPTRSATMPGQVSSGSQTRPAKLQRQLTRSNTMQTIRGDIRDASGEDLAAWTNNWQIMYCGGVGTLERTLEGFRQRYGVPVKIERYNW
jgi:hypothetical protein